MELEGDEDRRRAYVAGGYVPSVQWCSQAPFRADFTVHRGPPARNQADWRVQALPPDPCVVTLGQCNVLTPMD